MNILTEEIFVQIKARKLVAIATKASTQRGTGQKEPVKKVRNLIYKVPSNDPPNETIWEGFKLFRFVSGVLELLHKWLIGGRFVQMTLNAYLLCLFREKGGNFHNLPAWQ